MNFSLQSQFTQWKERGTLAVIVALLSELLLVLWVGFLLLFALESLLPTFVTIRVSLTLYLTILILGTLGALSLRQAVGVPAEKSSTFLSRSLTWAAMFGSALLIMLSLARFPLMAGVVFFIGYFILTALLWRFFMQRH